MVYSIVAQRKGILELRGVMEVKVEVLGVTCWWEEDSLEDGGQWTVSVTLGLQTRSYRRHQIPVNSLKLLPVLSLPPFRL